MKRVAIAVVLLTGTLSAQSDQPIVFPIVLTAPLVSYSGNLIQKMFPPNAPQVLLSDPPTPPGLNDTALPCPESQSGETFGRYNNVDIAYGVKCVVRTFLFDTSFDLKDSKGGRYSWTPCREAVEEEPQSEGLVFDAENDMLYVAFETIGLQVSRLWSSSLAAPGT